MINPYKATAKVFKIVGNSLLYGIPGAFILAVFAAAVASFWSTRGAWALLIPVIVVAGAVSLVACAALIAYASSQVSEWLGRKSRKWEQDNA